MWPSAATYGILLVCLTLVNCEITQTTPPKTTTPSLQQDNTSIPLTSSTIETTTTIDELCASANSSCEDCVKNTKCLYCKTTSACVPYPVGSILPHKSLCALSDARWGQCWVNFEALIITMGVVGGVILISLCCCVYCCCCRSKSNPAKWKREDEKIERKKEERQLKQDERKADRKAKTDEIRKKYGLVKEDNAYQRFDA